MLGRTNTGSGGVGGALTVTAPAGVTVEVSKDGKTKRKTSNAEGLAVFKGLATGTWTLTITDGSKTNTKPVEITADYSTVIAFFSATIKVTYPSGSACTCTDGNTMLSAPDTSGVWTCVVPNTGTWTVSCTDGSDSASKSVKITTEGQSSSLELSYRLYLYNAGDKCTNITGGWSASATNITGSNTTGTLTATNVTGGVKLTQGTAGGGGLYSTTNKISTKGYTKLKFSGTIYNKTANPIKIAVMSSKSSSGVVASKTFTKLGSSAVTYSDTDVLTLPTDGGSYYIGIAISSTDDKYITMKQLYFE